MDVTIYKSKRYTYIRIADLPEEWERIALDRWVFGKLQPLIQGETRTIIDAVFLDDFMEFRGLTKTA